MRVRVLNHLTADRVVYEPGTVVDLDAGLVAGLPDGTVVVLDQGPAATPVPAIRGRNKGVVVAKTVEPVKVEPKVEPEPVAEPEPAVSKPATIKMMLTDVLIEPPIGEDE